jgi:hypothetical protein
MHAMTMPRVRIVLLCAVVAALIAVVAFAMQRELAPRTSAPAGAGAGSAPQPVALSADEEAYAAALWPIHSEVVETSAVVMSFAGISYVTDHHDPHKLAAAASALHDTLEAADGKARALKVPDSMHKVQDQYLEAITLLKNASAEMAKVETDSKIEHLVTAQNMSYTASEDLLKVEDVLWPGEHRPN